MVAPAQRKTVFTKRLKEARKRAGLTQVQLGVNAGIEEFSASARVNQYERGVHAPDHGTAQRLAAALGVPTSYLFEEDDVIAHILLTVGGLRAAQRKKIARVIDELANQEP